jgi:hypothetical protein
MLENEYLYFQPLINFQKERDPVLRMDSNEGLLNATETKDFVLKVKGQKISLRDPHLTVRESVDEKIKVCSLYIAHIENAGQMPPIDSRMLEFGDTALVIHNHILFTKILDDAFAREEIYPFFRGSVDYSALKPKLDFSKLKSKTLDFDYQNEYRILIFIDQTGPFNLALPGLKECCKIFPAEDVPKINISFNK